MRNFCGKNSFLACLSFLSAVLYLWLCFQTSKGRPAYAKADGQQKNRHGEQREKFIIYMLVNTRLLKSIRPVVEGIEKLPTSEPVYIKERGLLSELADCVNQTSCLLQEKDKALKKKEMSRANWICGVSHDIRTPLSVVMGYAGQLEEAPGLDLEEKRKQRSYAPE